MNQLFDPFWASILSGLGVALLGILGVIARWLFSLKKTLDAIASKDEKRSEQIATLSGVTICTMRGSRAILEVVAQQKCNGNVEEAFRQFEAGEKIVDTFTEKQAWSV